MRQTILTKLIYEPYNKPNKINQEIIIVMLNSRKLYITTDQLYIDAPCIAPRCT